MGLGLGLAIPAIPAISAISAILAILAAVSARRGVLDACPHPPE